MRAMIEAALSLFRNDLHEEPPTCFDGAQMLWTIVDDYSDQGYEVLYIGPRHAEFIGRPLALKRAITNLVDNSVRYGGPSQLELCLADTQISIFIRDRGPGIPADVMEKVFDPFFRLEQSRNRATGGVGLGLTSARAVVRNHGGDIVIRNLSEGGLEVHVVLKRQMDG